MTLEGAVSKTGRKISTTRLFRPLSIKQILEMNDGGIKDAARDIFTNLQQSLREQFAIEKAVADLKRPRSNAFRTVTFGLTSGRTCAISLTLEPAVSRRQLGNVVQQGYFAP